MGLAENKYSEHYTVAEWEKWNDQWELINGAPYCMSPAPTVKHQLINTKLINQINNKLINCVKCIAIMPVDWQINDETVVQPDISVVCKEVTTNRLFFAPTIIFEILSPSTARKDKTEKYELYQTQGVRYYVMVNPDTKEIELFLLVNGIYTKQDFTDNYTFTIDECVVNIDFTTIW